MKMFHNLIVRALNDLMSLQKLMELYNKKGAFRCV